jgi:hypothetical protein
VSIVASLALTTQPDNDDPIIAMPVASAQTLFWRDDATPFKATRFNEMQGSRLNEIRSKVKHQRAEMPIPREQPGQEIPEEIDWKL